MYLIIGLGNIDKQYLNTYHNLGFMCADYIAKLLGVEFSKGECRAITAHTKVNGEKVIIAKPITYMNLSGDSVIELVNKYKIEQDKFLVIYDDIDIPIGSVRIRENGSAGTHNGMRSIVSRCNTTQFSRIRIGTGRPPRDEMDLADFVLSQISQQSHIILDGAIERGAKAAVEFANGMPILKVMEKFNLRVEQN
ncbi:MAG: aminoacyl-tRNA hydrolase [Clostridia bacterium]